MNTLLKASALAALVCITVSTAEAGGRRWAWQCQPGYNNYNGAYTYATPAAPVAPVAPNVATTVDGRQRYQSAYQAPIGPAPAAPTMINNYPGHYYDNVEYPLRALRFQDRTFQDQNRANRKILGL